MKILVADDLERVRSEFRRWLLRMDASWQVVEACTHDETIAAAGKERPDLALLDVVMPARPGERGEAYVAHTLESLRKVGAWVVVITGALPPDYPHRTLMDALESKPMTRERFEAVVRDAMARRAETPRPAPPGGPRREPPRNGG